MGLHDALYALLIEKLVRTDGFGVFDDGFEKKVLRFYNEEKSSKSPEFVELSEASLTANVASLGKLLERALPSSSVRVLRNVALETPSPTIGLNYLKEMRNYFAHPRPMSSTYYNDFLLLAVSDTIQVIKQVSELPEKRRLRHDPEEARILLCSIEYYLKRWEIGET